MNMRSLCLLLLLALSGQASALDGITGDIKVVQVGTYQNASLHYVWFSVAMTNCATTMRFDETKPGGKALFATLNIALINQRKVDVRYSDCDIIEVYLK